MGEQPQQTPSETQFQPGPVAMHVIRLEQQLDGVRRELERQRIRTAAGVDANICTVDELGQGRDIDDTHVELIEQQRDTAHDQLRRIGQILDPYDYGGSYAHQVEQFAAEHRQVRRNFRETRRKYQRLIRKIGKTYDIAWDRDDIDWGAVIANHAKAAQQERQSYKRSFEHHTLLRDSAHNLLLALDADPGAMNNATRAMADTLRKAIGG